VILLDTHAAIWFTAADRALGKQSEGLARKALADDRLAVSAITFWEIAMLTTKRRLESVESPAEQRNMILAAGIIELPITGAIALLSVELDDLHADPADRFIAATAIAHEATLMTADRRLLKWRNRTMKRQNASK
jgi:PIN domain nuclease of toxin-antitoxin system